MNFDVDGEISRCGCPLCCDCEELLRKLQNEKVAFHSVTS